MIDFYDGTDTGTAITARFGPFPNPSNATAPVRRQAAVLPFGKASGGPSWIGASGTRRAVTFPGFRIANWPGLARDARPAMARIDCPAASAISTTAFSVLNFPTGSGGTHGFRFDTVSGPSKINLTGLVTPAEVAAALAATIDAYTASLLAGSPFGYLTRVEGGTVYVTQARTPRIQTNALPYGSGSWINKTAGARANAPITADIPGEWTGRLFGFTGGLDGRGGVMPATPAPGVRWQVMAITFGPARWPYIPPG